MMPRQSESLKRKWATLGVSCRKSLPPPTMAEISPISPIQYMAVAYLHAVVVERAAGIARGIAPPHQRLRIERQCGAHDVARARGVDAHQRRLADGALVQQRLGLHDRRVIEEVLGHTKGRAGRGHGVRDAVG